MRSPNVLSEEDLKSYAEAHLQYEINMLTMSVGILAYLGTHNNTSLIPWVINNGILNTFAMHARNLIDFLYSRSKGKDFPTDIIIQDYVTTEDISLHLKPISPLLEEALIKANKQVAHCRWRGSIMRELEKNGNLSRLWGTSETHLQVLHPIFLWRK